LTLTILLAVGCGSEPFPLAAQAGSTIAIPVVGEKTANTNHPIGYGGTMLQQAGIYDDQRGELVFKLTGGGFVHTLITRFVTRLAPDPATQVAIDNAVDDPSAALLGLAQVLALVDIPMSVGEGDYTMTISRCRRTSSGGACLPLTPDVYYSRPFTVLPGIGTPTPMSGFVGGFSADTSTAMMGLYPFPKVPITFIEPEPAAAHLVVNYPKTKVEVQSVFEDNHQGRGSIVAWADDPVAGQVTIDFVDPDASVGSLAIAFKLIDPFGAGRVLNGDFSITSAQLYDADGVIQNSTLSVGFVR
jgi:hypothetical protein